MHRGYIKLFRKFKEWPFYKNPKHRALWVHLLLEATHKPFKVRWNSKGLTLMPGQLITGRNKLEHETGLKKSFIYRALKCYESEHQIEQQTSNTSTLITIINWDLYAGNEQQDEQQMNNKRTASEQPMNTKQEVKNVKNVKNARKELKTNSRVNSSDIPHHEIIEDLNLVVGSRYKHTTKKTQDYIRARWGEGFRLDDFKKVHRVKASDWINTEHAKYLRPETLYGTKFEGYLNQIQRDNRLSETGWGAVATIQEWLNERGDEDAE